MQDSGCEWTTALGQIHLYEGIAMSITVRYLGGNGPGDCTFRSHVIVPLRLELAGMDELRKQHFPV